MTPRQTALWSRFSVHNCNTSTLRKKHSEKRRRNDRITVRLLPSELEALESAAELLGVSRAELIRWSALDYIHLFAPHLKSRRNLSAKEDQS